MLKIIHTADNHLRSTQYGRSTRGDDFLAALLRVVQKAHEVGARHILNCGDLLDHSRPAIDTLFKLMAVHEALIDNEITMYMISGNHDKTTPPFAGLLRPSDYGIVSVDDTRFTLEGVSILALPFMPKASLLKRLAEEEPADVLMWHGPVADFSGVQLGENALQLAELPDGKFATVLLGDIHVHAETTTPGGSRVFMPGATELCQEKEPVDKAVFLLTFADGTLTDAQSLPIDTRPVLHATLLTEEAVTEFLDTLHGVDMTSPPIVFVKYDRDLPAVQSRVYQLIDPQKAIVRCLPLPKVNGVVVDVADMQDVSYVDLLGLVLGDDDQELLKLGSLLLNPDDAGVDAITAFICEAQGTPRVLSVENLLQEK